MESKDGHKAKLLVIQEDLIFARSLERQFQNAGFFVEAAGSVGHALWLMEDKAFDLAVFVFDTPPLKDLIVLHKLKVKQPDLKLIVYGLVRTYPVMNYLTRAGVDFILNRTAGMDEVLRAADRLAYPAWKYQTV
jgi:ActR/RegA family two-component response regulator